MNFRKTKWVVLGLIVVLNLLLIAGIRQWRLSHTVELKPRYPGATGPSIEALDRHLERWIAELVSESAEESLFKLTDAIEYDSPGPKIENAFFFADTHEQREKTCYRIDLPSILSNRRFRKALEELKKLPPKKSSALLIRAIRENLAEIKPQEQLDLIARKIHQLNFGYVIGESDEGCYRPRSKPGISPTRLGRRFAVFSYILIAAQLELRDVRPAIEDAIRLAKEEFAIFNNLDETATESFKRYILRTSLYNPSILVTGTLCDPSWNKEGKQRFSEKLKTRDIVDYRARATEYDWSGKEGWVPVEPFESMLSFRYYEQITDDEFLTAFP